MLKNSQEVGRAGEAVTYKGAPIRLSSYFSSETLQARIKWNNIFKILKEITSQQHYIQPSDPLDMKGEIKAFPDNSQRNLSP